MYDRVNVMCMRLVLYALDLCIRSEHTRAERYVSKGVRGWKVERFIAPEFLRLASEQRVRNEPAHCAELCARTQ